MKRVNIADLKNNLSRHLAHVRGGGDLVILDRLTPVARIIPFDRAVPLKTAKAGGADAYWTEERMAELEHRGVITRPDPAGIATWLKTDRPLKLPKGAPSAVELMLQARRESGR